MILWWFCGVLLAVSVAGIARRFRTAALPPPPGGRAGAALPAWWERPAVQLGAGLAIGAGLAALVFVVFDAPGPL
jgi:hypothetical protein